MLEAWDHLDVGGVVIGDVPSYRVDNMPYGGVKDSGLGREGVRFAMEDMTEIRNLVIRRKPAEEAFGLALAEGHRSSCARSKDERNANWRAAYSPASRWLVSLSFSPSAPAKAFS